MDPIILDREQYMVIPKVSAATWRVFRAIQLEKDSEDDSSCLYSTDNPNAIFCTEFDDPESEPWALYIPRNCEIWIDGEAYDYARDIYLEQTRKFLETEVKA